MKKDSFVFYRSFQDAIEGCPVQDQLTIYKAISRYALDRTEPELSGIAKVVWVLIKPQLDANWKRYENGLKGGAPRGNSNATKLKHSTKKQPKNNLDSTKKQPNVNVNVNDNVNENVNVKDIEYRKQSFLHTLGKFKSVYSNEMLTDFGNYWTEHGINDRKMRFEKQRTFGIEQRLKTWHKNETKWNTNTPKNTNNNKSAVEILREKHGITQI